MGLPLVPVLLQSAVARAWRSVAALANADCVYFYERALLEKDPRKGRGDNGEPRLAR
jgi:hypothetical protein